ncbi:MAG TPA: hypothetical protein VMU05_12880 [Dongiaceae bacterium]|nr:hypothetical protein [Dongiaceae bacterium]
MSFKLLKFPPQASTRSMRVPVRWMGMDGCLGGSGFLSSWVEQDDMDLAAPTYEIKWSAVAGLAFSLVISGAFWAGVGVLVSHLLR